MEKLPAEVFLHIISFLQPTSRDIVSLQLVSRHFLTLARDNALWKSKCFEESYQERRRQRFMNMATNEPAYAPLVQAILDLDGSIEATRKPVVNEKARALANWDPAYPNEKINYYEEYIHRHAPISVSWFETLKEGLGDEKEDRIATGMGILFEDNMSAASKMVASLDDGSVGIYCLQNTAGRGRLLARSSPFALTGRDSQLDDEQNLARSKAQMTETGAVECASIDSGSQRGYFGVMNTIVEMDLTTLRPISTQRYPFNVTALSEAKESVPLTVGTNNTLHLYDPRQQVISARPDSTVRTELISGSSKTVLLNDRHSSFATLSEPGPLSILHLSEDGEYDGTGSIWVAGRFTSLLNYDRRFFPCIRRTIHSGSRISCLRSLPQPFLRRETGHIGNNTLSLFDIRNAKSCPGSTLITAGEYRGKGALELYGLPSNPENAASYQNRQTASRSKLMSVTPHGGSLAYSDGDGNIKWVERDGHSPIREWNLNEHPGMAVSSSQITPNVTTGNGREAWDNTAVPDDIVQLMLPTMPKSSLGHTRLGEDNLVIWTGDGKLGLLGFGKEKWDWSGLEEQALEFEEQSRRKVEREYVGIMGRALRRQADEMHFVRNLGLGIP
ncbi:Threonine-tRNA ligase [Venturia nashicola]|nr:Threonine-tRNA ligase [Venturia nashicola]